MLTNSLHFDVFSIFPDNSEEPFVDTLHQFFYFFGLDGLGYVLQNIPQLILTAKLPSVGVDTALQNRPQVLDGVQVRRI